MKVEIILNTIFVAIIAFWAMYRGHITKKNFQSGLFLYGFGVFSLNFVHFAKKKSVLDEIIVPCQTLFLQFSFALFCLINLWQYHLTGEFKTSLLKTKRLDGWSISQTFLIFRNRRRRRQPDEIQIP